MTLETWMWNLGLAAAVTACGDKAGGDDCYSTPEGYSRACYYEEDDAENYDAPDYDDNEEEEDPVAGCRDDFDCPDGYCSGGGGHDSACVDFPRIPVCETETSLELSWVRKGDGSATAAGVVGRGDEPQRVLVVGADDVPLGLAEAESDAEVAALPIELSDDEEAVGIESVDLDGDGVEELLLFLRTTETARIVPLTLDVETGEYLSLDPVDIGEPVDAVRVQRGAAEGESTLYALSEAGRLLQLSVDAEGGFSEPVASPWADGEVLDFVVAPIDDDGHDDVVVLMREAGGGGPVVGLIGGLRVPFGVGGSITRRIHADVLRGHLVTTEGVAEAARVGRFFAGPNASVDEAVVTPGVHPLESAAMTDLDGDGQGDLVLLHRERALQIVFGVSTSQACVQTVSVSGSVDSLHVPASGSGRGVIASGPQGVLAIRGAAESKR